MSRTAQWWMKGLGGVAAAGALLGLSAPARAGTFDALGDFVLDPSAVVALDFEEPVERYVPEGTPMECLAGLFEQVESGDALEGEMHARFDVQSDCAERFTIELPPTDGSYRATLWMRHGSLDARISVIYEDAEELDDQTAKLFPTGRVTSDGWVELGSNEFPVRGAAVEVAYLRVVDDAHLDGVDLDAFELTRAGDYLGQAECSGVGDEACSAEEVCLYNRCRLGRAWVPPLPHDLIRDEVVDTLQSQMRLFFGGRKTRLEDLPVALEILESIRHAETAWAFWNGWGHAVRRLHDSHTSSYCSLPWAYPRRRRLNACFFEGDADLSQGIWPSDPRYKDLLVSHAGDEGNHGIQQGDRLVAVDGQHPFDWAKSLIEVDWTHRQASDSEVLSPVANRLRGWILMYATEFTVVHCSAVTGTCDPAPQTYVVAELPEDDGGQVSCDNRPFYHHEGDNNPGPNHNVGWSFYRGRIQNTTVDEAIYGMVWNTLMGGGDPQGWVNSHVREAVDDWRQNARGVILDHRTGNGGTIDTVQYLSELTTPSLVLMVDLSPIPIGGFDGPATTQEGLQLFQQLQSSYGVRYGAADYDPQLPVAFLIHSDVSASDYLPWVLKGSPKVRLFGPGPTEGAFSTYLTFRYWGGVGWTLASGEPISYLGQPLMGHGVEPDEVVVPRQSDLLAGVDTIHEAALAWVRQELKP